MSVRDRLERGIRQQPEPLAPKLTRTSMTAGNASTASVRERAGAAATLATEEKLKPPDRRGSAGVGTSSHPQTSGVRERLEREQCIARDQAEHRAQTDFELALRPYWERGLPIDWERQLEVERLRLNAEADAQKAREQQQRIENEKRAQKERLRDRLLAIAYSSLGATPEEQAKINQLMTANKPSQFGNPDAHKVMLLELRALQQSKPEWAS